MKKLFDTNVVLDYPQIVLEDDAVLSIYVLKELDSLKNSPDAQRARKARNATRFISKHLDNLFFDATYLPSRDVDEALIDMASVNKYVLITNDINLQLRCRMRNVHCEEYAPADKQLTNVWKKEVQLSNDELAVFYSTGAIKLDAHENQYIMIKNEEGKIVDKYRCYDGRLVRVPFKVIRSDFSGEIKPRNLEQECALDMLNLDSASVKVLTGRYGSGKTFLMLSCAIEALNSGKFDKIVYVRNNIGVRDTMELGSLPGDEIDKLYPYLMPLADKVGGKFYLDKMLEDGEIEPIHLGYLRGRDLKNCLIYCTEAQNLTTDHVKLLLGRVGEGSELWLDGDFKAQVDKKVFQNDNGLRSLIEHLSGNPHFVYVNLEKSERSPVAALADLLDEG